MIPPCGKVQSDVVPERDAVGCVAKQPGVSADDVLQGASAGATTASGSDAPTDFLPRPSMSLATPTSGEAAGRAVGDVNARDQAADVGDATLAASELAHHLRVAELCDQCTLKQLKEMCRERGKPLAGNKRELAARLCS